MSYKKFQNGDLFYNTIKAKPRFEFKIWGGKAVVNSGTGLSILNESLLKNYYPFLPKGSNLSSFKTVTAEQFSYSQYGEIFSGSYPRSSSIDVQYFYQNSGFLSEKRRIYALKNILNSYLFLSNHYAYSSSFGNKGEQTLSLVSLPSIYYGSAINKGSVELTYYVSGTLIGKLQDINKNGELIQTTGSSGLGKVAGVVLYNEGFVILTGSWNLDAHTEIRIYNPSPAFTTPKWNNWGAGLNQPIVSTNSSSFDFKFEGVNYIHTISMLAHADKGELNHSNNPTYIKLSGSNLTPKTNNKSYVEYAFNEVKNTVKYLYDNFTGSLEKHTYISKVGIYDENRNLIGIAKLAKPIRKTENRDFTFKLKVDI